MNEMLKVSIQLKKSVQNVQITLDKISYGKEQMFNFGFPYTLTVDWLAMHSVFKVKLFKKLHKTTLKEPSTISRHSH